MKKVIAVLLVCAIMMSCSVVYAQQATKSTQEKSMVRGFWTDAANLFRKQIPETRDQHSKTYNLWDPTTPGGKSSKMK